MKKVLSVVAVSAFVLSAGAAFAGGYSKQEQACQEACQQQIDDLLSSQAQQDEVLRTHAATLDNHEARITELERPWPWYVRLGVRAAWMEHKTGPFDIDSDTGWGGAIAIGRKLDSPFLGVGSARVELEFAYQGADLDEERIRIDGGGWEAVTGDDYSLMTIMLNGYYEFPIAEGFALYGMAGLGYAKFDVDYIIRTYTEAGAAVGDPWSPPGVSDNAFAYKLGAGVTYNFDEMWAMDLGYEYLGVSDAGIADSINGHNVVLSVRFMF